MAWSNSGQRCGAAWMLAVALLGAACDGKKAEGLSPSAVADPSEATQQPKPPSDLDRCSTGDAKACEQAASTALASKTDADEVTASALLEKACGLKDLDGCFQLGKLQEAGGSRVKSLPKALGILERACTDGHEQSCLHLGAIYIEGRGVPADPRKGLTFDERACARSAASSACTIVGWLLVSGQAGVPQDLKRGLDVLTKSVEAGNVNSKARLADVFRAAGEKKDLRLALSLYEDACAGGDPESCYWAGDFYKRGLLLNVNFIHPSTTTTSPHQSLCSSDRGSGSSG